MRLQESRMSHLRLAAGFLCAAALSPLTAVVSGKAASQQTASQQQTGTPPKPDDSCPDSSPGTTTRNADAWGEISIAQPKIWQFERVNALLDGLLRDIEGVS